MATDLPGSNSGLFSGVVNSGRGMRPRGDDAVATTGHSAASPTVADGNFLGNVHQGRSVDPAAHADSSLAEASAVPAAPAAAIEIPEAGLPVELPLLPNFPGVSIAIEISGLPENVALSSGRAQTPGQWRLGLSDAEGLRLVPSGGAGENALSGPFSLDVAYVVTNDATGESSRTGTTVSFGEIPQLGPVSAVSDADAADNTVSEGAADGDSVGIEAAANDPDPYDRVIYTLLDDAGGRFEIDPLSGEVTVADAALLDYEAAPSHTIVVQAESTDGSKTTATFTIDLTDDTGEFAVTPVADTDAAADGVSETVSDGATVGVTAFASDADGTDTVAYSLTDDAGGRFAIDATTGVVTVADAALLDYETATEHTITVQAESSDGSTETKTFTITLADDTGEFAVTPVTDADAAADGVSEGVSDGATVGVTAFASDADATDTVTYSLTDDSGGRFAIDATTGVVTVADASLLDYETATEHTITVQAESSDGSTRTKTFTVALSDDTGEFAVSAVSDTDADANGASESASNGDTVGVTAFASDADATDTVTYSLTDDAGGRFAIDAATGEVTVADASLLDYETATEHTITVQAESSDGSTQTKDFSIALSDDTGEFAVSAVSDTDADADGVSEGVSDGATVGVTAFASDADSTDTVTYSLTDDAGGRFAIDASTGVVTVADASLLDYETATSHTITVQAESSDGSTQTKEFAISLSDDTGEFAVSAVSDTDADADGVSEGVSDGSTVGVTAFASDADSTDTVAYSLTDDAGGRFAIDAATGVVTVADAALLDYETATEHTITVQAESSDGSTETKTFTITLSDDTGEFSVSPVADADGDANAVSEAASNGDAVGITALASDADATDTVTYSLTDDAGGRFAIDSSTGQVTVADAALLDHETDPSHTVTVQATSSDGSTATETFMIAVTDANEAPTSAGVDGPAPAGGAVVHLDATDIDADGRTADNPADGEAVARWDDASGGDRDAVQRSGAPAVAADAINGNDAIDFAGANDALHIRDDSAINLASHEQRSHAIAFQTGDDVSGFQVIYEEGAHVRGYSLSIAGDPANGGQPTLWGFVYNNAEWEGGNQYKAINLGPVEANQTYSVVMVHDASAGDLADRTFSAYVNGDYRGTVTHADVQQAHSGDIGVGGYIETTIHPVTNEVLSGTGGEFAGMVGEVMIWNDALDPQQISETSSYLNEKWGGAPSVSEGAPNGTAVFAVADIVDPDASETFTYALTDDAGGRFAIDAATGVVTVADASLLDHEADSSHTVTVQVTDSGGHTLDLPVTVQVGDGSDTVGAVSDSDAAADGVSEGASNGDVVGITAFASDPDAGDTVTYSLTDDAGGRFAIDAATGQVTVADAALLDYETATSHTITVQAESSDGSTQTKDFAISLSDDTGEFSISAVSDTDADAEGVSEGASNGDTVGVTAFASDADATDTVTYSLTDDAGGRFAIDAATGVVTVADASLLDYETATSHTITVQAESTDGSTQTKSFAIALSDDTGEFSVSAVSDTDADADGVSEGVSDGAPVGVTAFASDADATDTVTYSLTDDAGGRFAIDAATGVVTVADASLLDYETATSHTITVQAESSDGSTQAKDFAIALSDDTGEFLISAVSDTDADAEGVSEGASNGDTVGITAFASDADATDTVTYSLTDDAGGRFAIDAATGVVTVADASLLDYETATSHTITVQAESTDGSTQTKDFAISVSDDTGEFSVSAVSDSDATANAVSEDASNGDAVGVTALAGDADASDSVTYSLTDDAGGRFAIDASTGQVTVADASLLDHEADPSHTVTVQATSTDGSTRTADFTIAVTDSNDAPTDLTFTNGDTYGSAVEGHEPVAHWRLAESAGSTVASDAMGNHDGSYAQGANSENAAGPFAGISSTAANFDGANDYVEVPTSPDFVLPEGTIQAWFKIDAFGGHDHTILSMDSSGTDTGGVYLAVDGGRKDVEFFIEDSAASVTFGETRSHHMLSGNNTVGEGSWHHVAVTFGPSGMVMYLDGVQVATNAYTGGIGNADGEPITIGASQRNAGTEGAAQPGELDRFLDGQIAEVALYDTALSGAELTSLADAGINGSDIVADTVVENADDGTVVGLVEATDPDSGETFTYALLDDAGGRFAIDAATGVVTVADGSLLNYETDTQHDLTVQVTDSAGNSYSESFTVNLVDASELSGPGFVVGTEAADLITGTDNSETSGGEEILVGLGGDDVLIGNGNEDRLVGGDGDDTLSGGAGDDVLIGDAGDDTADGGSGDDVFVFRMGDGNDAVSGGTGNDTIMLVGADGGIPDPSDWSLNLTAGSASWSMDHVSLSSGAAGTVTFSDGSSVSFDGVETIDFSGSYDVDGGNGAVQVADVAGDALVGGNVENTMIGGSGADSLSGGHDEDLLIGGGGGDALYGGNQDDLLDGGAGSDALYGERGDDVLLGGEGNDALYGGNDDDVLHGGAGDDALYGGSGDDILSGGLGDDTAEGGTGDDTFIFGAGWGNDSFDGGGGPWTDTIQLSGVDGVAAYNGWTVAGATVVDSGDNYVELASDSDGTITMDDGSELAFTDVDRIEW